MRRPNHHGFTLIELLVVIGIIALLVGILMPALASARRTARLVTCGSMEHQLGLGLAAYAGENRNVIPRGPDTAAPFPPVPYKDLASNQVWIKAVDYNAHGLLLKGYIDDKRAMFCPGDDTADPVQEIQNVGSLANDAYSSYMFRQLDETTNDKFDDLGKNGLGTTARALLIDCDALITAFPNSYRTNHDGKVANVLYLDGHVKAAKNVNNIFSMRDADLGDSEARLNQILQNADFVEQGDPAAAPNP
jgi:prepilin-type N-terminal cleavage/methylation domain-containing protein/prepilin-type processing-associated H-X9-DG protein